MSNQPTKIDRSLFLRPQATPPENPIEGEIYNDAIEGLLVFKEGSFQALGTGAGGNSGINFLTLDATFLPTKPENSDFEDGIGDYVTYADAAGIEPVDGDGGSPNVTFAQTLVSALNGEASGLFTKGAANRQGEGVACPFVTPLGYRNRRNSVTMAYSIASGTYTAGAVSVWIYDVTNSILLNCGNNIINTSSGMLQMYADFNDGVDYRLIIHVAGTDTNAYTLKIDDVKVSPQEVVNGAALGDFQPYTPILTAFGTATDINFRFKQLSDSVHIIASFASGTSVSSEARASLPNNYTAKMPTPQKVGDVSFSNSGAINQGHVFASNGNSYVTFPRTLEGASGNTNSNGNSLVGSGDFLYFEAIVPVNELSSNINLSNSSTFRISPILANGTRVTGAAPTQLGQYRSYLRNAGASSYTETNGSPGTSPTSADGIVLYGGEGFGSADTNNQPSRYDIFVGKNKTVLPQFSSSSGRTGFVSIISYLSSTTLYGTIWNYDPTTGIVRIQCAVDGSATTAQYVGQGDGGTQLSSLYFDFIVSENAQAVGLDPNSIPWKNTVYIKDVKAAATSGGTFTSGAWRTRDLNTLENPFSVSWVSLNTNQFTLDPGTYEFEATAPAIAVDGHKAKLRNITAGSDTIIGQPAASLNSAGDHTNSISIVKGIFTIGSTTVFELQHQCSTTRATNGFGFPAGFSVSEVYSQVKISRLT